MLAAQGFRVRLWGLHGLEDLRVSRLGVQGSGVWGVGGAGFKASGFRGLDFDKSRCLRGGMALVPLKACSGENKVGGAWWR